MCWSNNEQDIYHFQIDRVEPLRIPWGVAGDGAVPVRIFYWSLKDILSERSLGPRGEDQHEADEDLEFGFSRMVLWAARDSSRSRCTRSFGAFQPHVGRQRNGDTNDPGARFSSFDSTGDCRTCKSGSRCIRIRSRTMK